MKILLVEDDKKTGQLIHSMLEHWQQQVVLAEDGRQARKILQEQPVQFLISDWMLPSMTGTELVQEIRQLEQFQTLPILMISGKADKPDIVEAAQTGIDGYLTKPFTPNQLRSKIRSAWERRESLNKEQQLKEICRGHQAFDKKADTPLVLFGEAVNTFAELKKPPRKTLMQYLIGAGQSIARLNQEHADLDLGYRIETSTKNLSQYIKRQHMRDRVEVVLLAPECSGNSILMARLININYGNHIDVFMVCDQPELIPIIHRAGLEKLGVDILRRNRLDAKTLHRLLEQCAIQPADSAPQPLSPDEIRQRITDDLAVMASLPTLPQVYQKISALANDPDSDIKEWGQAISVDPLTSAVILRCARSPTYGFQKQVDDVQRAVVLLGKKTIKDLVASEAVKRAFAAVEESGFALEDFWLHNVAVGFIAQLLAFPLDESTWTREQKKEFTAFNLEEDQLAVLKRIDLPHRLRLNYAEEDPFLGGMLHDIGKAAMVQAYPDLYPLLLDEMKEHDWKMPMIAVEAEVAGGLTHPVVGEILGEKWEIDEPLRRAIRQHHHAEIDDTLSFLIGAADILGQAIYPFPADIPSPVQEALNNDSLDKVEHFLPADFLDQPLLSAEELVELSGVVLPLAKRLTTELQAAVA